MTEPLAFTVAVLATAAVVLGTITDQMTVVWVSTAIGIIALAVLGVAEHRART